MTALPEPRTPSFSGRHGEHSRSRPRPFLRGAAAAIILSMLAACVTMGGITKRTADSPAHSWTPPSKEEKPPAPLPSPAIPVDLQAPGKAWTLSDVVDVGLDNNPQTRAAWNAARAASAAVSISQGAYLPEINATLPATKQKMAFAGGRFIVDQMTLTPTASLSLLLFDFGGREAGIESARRTLEAANWTQNAVLQNVILQIESTYYQYIAARALLEAQETNLKGAQANYEAADARHLAGLATIADVLQAKTALSTIVLQIVTTRGLIQTLHGALANSMGLPANTAFDIAEGLPEDIPFDAVAKQVDLCIKDAEVRRPDIAASRALVLVAEAGIRQARATLFPAFSLSGNIGRIYYKDNSVSNPFYAISVSVNLPFLFGLQEYQVLAAKAQAEAARDRMAELGRGIELQVWVSYYGLKTAEQKIRTARDLLESANASYDVALGRYKEGVGTILDLLAAQTVLQNGRVQLVEAKSDWLLALVQFTHDTGALEPPAAPAKSGLPSSPEKGEHRP
ncbi:MAG: TolC family protein [Candidatus Aminicenantes bacterium]|nr:TolC family protein [Candidatus Aminicenantes bacterium]